MDWDGKGEIVGGIYILEDVTRLKRAKDELLAANERLRAQMDEIRQLQWNLRDQAIRDRVTADLLFQLSAVDVILSLH